MTEHRRNLNDDADTWWTIDQAAAHFGITRASILRWIREGGLKTYGKEKLLHRPDVLAEKQRRWANMVKTRAIGGTTRL